MANRLKMANHEAIVQLHALHWSQRRIVVGPDALGITTTHGTRHYPWSEIGSATMVNVL